MGRGRGTNFDESFPSWMLDSRHRALLCSAIRVLINMLAPASSTKNAAICVTAKSRWLRLVPLVVRRLPLDGFCSCEESAESKRGKNAKITEAATANTAPISATPG